MKHSSDACLSHVCRALSITACFVTLFLLHQKVFPATIEGQSQKLSEVEIKKDESDWQHFNSTNPFVDSWCPNASCSNSPLCSPCQKRFLFLIGTGRAGSTTLLRMFNELPNVRLSGENYDELRLAAKLSSNLFGHDQFKYDEQQGGPFLHNAIPTGSFGCVMQDLVGFLDPPPMLAQTSGHINEYDNDRILGMKTIRLHDDWNARHAADFFKNNFPCSRFVVNIRSDLESQVESMNSLHSPWNANEEKIEKANKFYRNFTRIMGGHAAQLIDMSEWKDDVGILNSVVDWLGYKNCAFNDIYHENSKESGGFGTDKLTRIDLGPNCTLT